jgi:hypothetical protein
MTTALQEANDAMRAAVRERLDATPKDDPKMHGYEQGCCDGGRCHPAIPATADVRPGSDAFLAALEELGALHLRKTLDYGVAEDALANIRNSADVINVPAYAGCVLRMSDKMHRLKAFFRRGQVEFDGVEDTLLDLAAYSLIALVLYREAVR